MRRRGLPIHRACKRFAAAAVGLNCAAVAWPASAQSPPPLCSGPVFQDGASAIQGTMSDQLLGAALRRNAQIYGAANVAQRKLLPLLNDKDFGIIFDSTTTYGAMRVPFCQTSKNGAFMSNDPPRMYTVDLSTVSMAAGGTYKSLTIYYAASASMHITPRQQAMRIAQPMLTVGALTYFPVGFFKREIVYDDMSIIWDYIMGVQWRAPVGEIAFGYLGSKGLFTNLSERHVKAFVGAVVNDLAAGAQIPYLAGGLSSLDWLVPKDAVDNIGSTAVSVRRLLLPSAPPPQLAAPDLASSARQSVPQVTTYLEQTGISKIFDLIVAAQYQPTVQPYELSAAWHSPDYLRRPVQGERSDRYEGEIGGYRLTVGTVKVPDLWYYGVQGGYKIRASAEASVVLSGQAVTFGLGVNNPSILAAFPYAYNAVQFTMSLNNW